MIFLLHVAMSNSSPVLIAVFFKSRWHSSFHLVFSHSLFLFSGISVLNTFLGMCSSALLFTCPYQFNLLSVIFLEACITLVVPRMCSFLILSLRVTLRIHRSIITSIRFSCRIVVYRVSAPCIIAIISQICSKVNLTTPYLNVMTTYSCVTHMSFVVPKIGGLSEPTCNNYMFMPTCV